MTERAGDRDTCAADPSPAPRRTDTTIPAQFAELVDAEPERTALRSPERSLTWSELDRWSNRLAHPLADHGDRRPVAVLCDHEIETLVGVLGAIKAGRPALFVSVDEPPERLAAMLDAAGASALIATDGESWSSLATGRMVVAVDAPGDETPVDVVLSPDDPAVVKFTSGSTGTPKGIAHSQRGVLAMICGFVDALDISVDDHLIAPNRLLTLDVFTGLLTPIELSMFDVRTRGADALLDWMSTERVTMLRTTPTVLRRLATAAEPDYPDLRTVAVAGEAMPPADVARVRTSFGASTRLIHFYGTGETGVTTRHVVDDTVDLGGDTLPAGRPVRGVEFELVDPDGARIAGGQAGVIAIGGDSLALGYVGLPDLTAERFRGSGSQRRFVSGDLGRIDRDGRLHVLGRTDLQVKIAGNRVELAEVESSLRRVLGVDDATVLARQIDGVTRLVGYYRATRDLAPSGLRGALRASLPDHMIPTAWVRVPAIPVNVHGKVDHAALPEPPRRPRPVPVDLTPTEARMAVLWETALGVEGVGPDDSFFALGGDSLAATALTIAAEDAFGRRLPVATLLADDSLRAMCAVVDAHDDPATGPRLVPINRTGDRHPIFCPHLPGWAGIMNARLAQGLDAGHPVIGIVDAVTSARRPDRDVTATADRYLELIVASADPPYYLLGNSAAGVLAYEIGRRLARRGLGVAFVGMVDTTYPHRLIPATWWPWRAVRGGWRRLRRPVIGPAAVRSRLTTAAVGAPTEIDRLRVLRRSLIAYRRYRVAAPGGPVTLFRATGGGRRGRRSATRWARWIEHIVEVPGTHDGVAGILGDENIDHLLGAVRAALRLADETVDQAVDPRARSSTAD